MTEDRTAREAFQAWWAENARSWGTDKGAAGAGFDAGYEAGRGALVDVGLNHPVSEDLAQALRMGQEQLERALAAEQRVRELEARIADMEKSWSP